VTADHRERFFDIPWLIMDSVLAKNIFNWEPDTSLLSILDEIALHAETHPNWLELSGIL
jgi:CDP-paratose 2-epimerase